MSTSKTPAIKLECGESSGYKGIYWIRDTNTGRIIATGVERKYAEMIVEAVNKH